MILADTTAVIKLICKDKKIADKFSGSIVVRNFTKGYSCLFGDANITASKSHPIELPQEIINQADSYIGTPTTTETLLKDVKETKAGEFLTVTGTVVHVSIALDFPRTKYCTVFQHSNVKDYTESEAVAKSVF